LLASNGVPIPSANSGATTPDDDLPPERLLVGEVVIWMRATAPPRA